MHRAFTEKNGKKVVEIAHTKFKKTNPELANSVKEIHVPIMPKCSPGGQQSGGTKVQIDLLNGFSKLIK